MEQQSNVIISALTTTWGNSFMLAFAIVFGSVTSTEKSANVENLRNTDEIAHIMQSQ